MRVPTTLASVLHADVREHRARKPKRGSCCDCEQVVVSAFCSIQSMHCTLLWSIHFSTCVHHHRPDSAVLHLFIFWPPVNYQDRCRRLIVTVPAPPGGQCVSLRVCVGGRGGPSLDAALGLDLAARVNASMLRSPMASLPPVPLGLSLGRGLSLMSVARRGSSAPSRGGPLIPSQCLTVGSG